MSDTKGGSRVGDLPRFSEWDEPMPGIQGREAKQVEEVLQRYFDLQRHEVSREEPVCYDRRDRRLAVAPDVFVALDVPSRIRTSYLPWKEGAPPSWVLEIASESTAERDRKEKPLVYHALGVKEMFLFDPESLYHAEVLTGFRWKPDGYERIEPQGQRFRSEVLGLELEIEPYVEDKVRYFRLRFIDPATGSWLSTTQELLSQKDRALEEKDRLIRELQARLGSE